MQPLANTLTILGREALRIVLPSWCAACERELPWRARRASCCADCWAALPRIEEPKCATCALPLPAGGERCIDCMVDAPQVDWCDAWGHYRGTLERLLHAFKFERHDFLDDPLAALLAETIEARGDVAFEAIVPVPMSRAKERRRGYNQAELLARSLARRIGVRCEPTLLTKKLDRAAQSTLPRAARAANVRGSFVASKLVADRSILLVDDICTTGATLRAASAELVRAGAARVSAIAVARA